MKLIREKEYTKKWMAIFTLSVLALLLFTIPLILLLLILHIKLGLSREMCKIFVTYYLSFDKVLITAYAVTFITQMGKAFLAKREEEKNRLKKED